MNRRGGFTLLETALLILILAILIYLGAVSFLHYLPKYSLHNAIWEISARLNEARYKSVLESAPVRLRFSNDGYALEQQDSQDHSWRRISGRRLEGVTLRANNTPTFHPQGTVSNLATIWVENSWGKYKLTLAITGRVKIVKA